MKNIESEMTKILDDLNSRQLLKISTGCKKKKYKSKKPSNKSVLLLNYSNSYH